MARTRAVHYHAHGGGHRVFPCYLGEMDSYLASGHERETFRRFSLPVPRRSTNLDRVTCSECWKGIYRMAVGHLSQSAIRSAKRGSLTS